MKQTEESDSAVGCTPWSFWRTVHHLTPRCDAHCGAWLRGGMHTAESNSTVGCTLGSFLKIRISRQNRNRIRKYLSLFIRGPDGFESWTKQKVENLVTHSLYCNCKANSVSLKLIVSTYADSDSYIQDGEDLEPQIRMMQIRILIFRMMQIWNLKSGWCRFGISNQDEADSGSYI